MAVTIILCIDHVKEECDHNFISHQSHCACMLNMCWTGRLDTEKSIELLYKCERCTRILVRWCCAALKISDASGYVTIVHKLKSLCYMYLIQWIVLESNCLFTLFTGQLINNKAQNGNWSQSCSNSWGRRCNVITDRHASMLTATNLFCVQLHNNNYYDRVLHCRE